MSLSAPMDTDANTLLQEMEAEFGEIEQLPDSEDIDEGALVRCELYFKFEEGWSKGLIQEFIPHMKRSGRRPFQYVASFGDDNICIRFDESKYCDDGLNAETEAGSWFITRV